MLWTLLHRDYRRRDFQNSLPVTEATIENLINGFSSLESWAFNLFVDGKALKSYDQHSEFFGALNIDLFEKPVHADELYRSYCSYAGSGYRERKESFGIKLRRILPSLINKKVSDEGNRSRHYVFPTLEKARQGV